MKITILGSGNSGGVPLIGNDWGICDPLEKRNSRLRASILLSHNSTELLLDTGPDMRQQMLACGLKSLSAVLYTHAHADHINGIDDLRSFNWLMQKPIPVFADGVTLAEIKNRFGYIFSEAKPGEFYKPVLETHVLELIEDWNCSPHANPERTSSPEANCNPQTIDQLFKDCLNNQKSIRFKTFTFSDLEITPFFQTHGKTHSIGYRVNDFAYSTDVNFLSETAFDILHGIKMWVVDCIREEPHPTHSHLAQTLSWIERIKPEKAFLTHLDQSMDFQTISEKLPSNVFLGYDTLQIEC